MKNRRFYPTTGIEAYIANPLIITEEILSKDELLTEKIFLSLRSNIGIEKSSLSKDMQERANMLCQENKLRSNSTHYYNDNFFLADELSLYILG